MIVFIVSLPFFISLTTSYKSILNKFTTKKTKTTLFDMLPSYRTMKYKSPIWGYFHVQKKQNRSNSKGKNS